MIGDALFAALPRKHLNALVHKIEENVKTKSPFWKRGTFLYALEQAVTANTKNYIFSRGKLFKFLEVLIINNKTVVGFAHNGFAFGGLGGNNFPQEK